MREVDAGKEADKEKNFNSGFSLGLILLVRSFPALVHEAFEIFNEAGYEISDFDEIEMDESDRKTLKQIFA
jgi:hypothetical protein